MGKNISTLVASPKKLALEIILIVSLSPNCSGTVRKGTVFNTFSEVEYKPEDITLLLSITVSGKRTKEVKG